MLVKAILLIVIGSMIGWVTNYIAIKMLFKPYEEINLGFFKIQGLIPKRRHEIGLTLADTIQKELISMEDITKKLEKANLDVEMERVIDNILEKKLATEITTKFPMLAMFLNESALKKIKEAIKGSIMENKDQIISMLFETLEKNVDFKEIIVEKVDAFSLEELERITFSLAKKELKHIELIGAVLGGVIGIVQFIITVLV
ncbi:MULTISPECIES: DUF445 domain-containing protein [Cetobacterium]|jgi:uncharacterized membrane protein YheB (UPF0754 family)|uniref:DUF445 family protein n=1 Tax=Candidatus Cetobacterium colombiensis TaxID=3073100 RepID=A0ABU4WCR2_9FUSO|nr:DUF445 family protein [Candidatus Cetobacterium colombiensis]MDX8336489.1 DUF445 family protein [Candidatus Cetobacterium colombiensis]